MRQARELSDMTFHETHKFSMGRWILLVLENYAMRVKVLGFFLLRFYMTRPLANGTQPWRCQSSFGSDAAKCAITTLGTVAMQGPLLVEQGTHFYAV